MISSALVTAKIPLESDETTRLRVRLKLCDYHITQRGLMVDK